MFGVTKHALGAFCHGHHLIAEDSHNTQKKIQTRHNQGNKKVTSLSYVEKVMWKKPKNFFFFRIILAGGTKPPQTPPLTGLARGLPPPGPLTFFLFPV